MKTRNGLDDGSPEWFWRLQNLLHRLVHGEITQKEADEEVAEMKAAASAAGHRLDVQFTRAEATGFDHADRASHAPEERRQQRRARRR